MKQADRPHPIPGLRTARQAKGLTQGELGGRLGLTKQQIARWEAGDSEPLLSAALALARELGTTAEALAGAPTPVIQEEVAHGSQG